jgi:hypothetical protein
MSIPPSLIVAGGKTPLIEALSEVPHQAEGNGSIHKKGGGVACGAGSTCQYAKRLEVVLRFDLILSYANGKKCKYFYDNRGAVFYTSV